MSTGPVKPFIDYSENAGGDTGENADTSILPYTDGEDLVQAVLRRPVENLRERTENVRDTFDDVLYLEDADRALAIGGPGTVTWPGSTTNAQSGIPTLSDNLYIMPFLTPGAAQGAPVPPVASQYGTLTLEKVGATPGILVTSMRRSYAGGDKINVTVVAGGAAGTVTAQLLTGTPQRSILLTANAPTLLQVITALNAITADAPATQLVNAALTGGSLNTDILLVPQAKQFISGNYDGEGHALTPAALAAFFVANPTSALAEGDTLCIQYSMMVDTSNVLGGRRQSIPENSNTAIPAGSLFNSRVHPDRLVNAIPICKVVNGSLVFINGAALPQGATGVSPGAYGPATTTQLGLVKLAYAAGTPAAPKVAPIDANGQISNTATGGNAFGFSGTGNGTGAGVAGQGGAANAPGVFGEGSGAGAGVNGLGGAASGAGVYGFGGTPNGIGVQGVASGAAPGGYFAGGPGGGQGASHYSGVDLQTFGRHIIADWYAKQGGVDTLVAYINSLGKFVGGSVYVGRVAIVPRAVTQTGFSPVIQNGPGGTITISGTNAPVAADWNHYIKIVTNGGLGTGQFQRSINGGKTYGGVVTIPIGGVWTSPEGITVTFAGVFQVGTVYSWDPTMVPQTFFTDANGNAKERVDHNGFMMGRVTQWSENWFGADYDYSGGVVGGFPRTVFTNWQLTAGGGTGTPGVTSKPYNDTALPGRAVQVGLYDSTGPNTPLASDGTYSVLYSICPLFVPAPQTSYVAEFEGYLFPYNPVGFINNETFIGLTDTFNTPFQAARTVGFYVKAGGANSGVWGLRASDGVNYDTTYTTLTAAVSTYYRLRFEYHGASTQIGTDFGGPTALFFINDQYAGYLSRDIGTAPMYWVLAMQAQNQTAANSGGGAVRVGPLRSKWSRYLDSDL